MSRSFKKNLHTSYTYAKSEKIDKKIWHKKLRKINNNKLSQVPLIDLYIQDYLFDSDIHCSLCCPMCENLWPFATGGYNYPVLDRLNVSDIWFMSKDGKNYYSESRALKYLNTYGFRKFYKLFSK